MYARPTAVVSSVKLWKND